MGTVVVLVSYLSLIQVYDKMSAVQGSTFLYFAFGSNLSSERIRINNPSARFKSIGKLHNHKLDFNYFSKRWQGSPATIIEVQDDHLWSVLWNIWPPWTSRRACPRSTSARRSRLSWRMDQ